MEERRKREGKRGKEDSVVAFIRNPSVSLSATLVYRIRAVEGNERNRENDREEEEGGGKSERAKRAR